MRKTVLGMILAGALVIALAGCGDTKTQQTTAPTAGSNTPSNGGSGGSPSGGTAGSGGTGGSTGSGGSSGSGSGGSGGSSGSGSGGSGSGGSTGGGSSQPAKHYSETIFPTGSFGAGGTVDVNPMLSATSTPLFGQYWITFAGGTNDAVYVARFCPFAVQGCTTFSDQPTFRNSGGMQFQGTFPGHGTFSGEFVVSRNGADTWATGFSLPPNGSAAWGNTGATPLMAQLVKASALSDGLGAQAQFGIGSDPLTDGSLTVTQPDAMARPSVTGASPNTPYTVSYCNPVGTSCTPLGTLTTDGSGNGSAALSIQPVVKSGDVNSGQFKLSRNGASGPVEFVSGFIVP